MSPKVLEAGALIFWFHSYEGKGSQDDYNDAKVWLEPEVEIARLGRTLRRREINCAVHVIEQELDYLLGDGMTISVKEVKGQSDEQIEIKRFKVQHPASAYTLPTEAKIHEVWFDKERIHIELMDGRALLIPLCWIPTLHEAAPADREKYEINRNRTMLIWDPNKCSINDELSIPDYLGPCQPRLQ